MEIIKISILVIIAVVLVNSLPTYSREISIITTFSCCIVVLLYISKAVIPAVDYIKNIIQTVSFENYDIVFKAVGIGFVTQFVSDIAADLNNKALANQMIFAGRVCIILLAMPVFLQIFEIIERLMQI